MVLCLSVPSDKWTATAEQLASLAGAIRGSLPERSTLHVFTDDLCHELFVAATKQVGTLDAQGRVISLYDLPPKASTGEDREHSWWTWIVESLAGRAADIVHFVASGSFFADYPRLVIAREPMSAKATGKAARAVGRPLRYVTPLALSELLTLLGAWGVMFSTPARGSWLNQERMSLRLLVDQIGRLRPGVAAFHDLEADSDCKALAETYEFMIGGPSIKASSRPSVSVYCHPARAAAVAAEPTSIPGDLMKQYAKVKKTIQSALARGGPRPAWVASTQRIVEQAVSRVSSQDRKDDEASIRGLASALEYVDQMLAEPVQASASREGTSAGTQGGGTTSV